MKTEDVLKLIGAVGIIPVIRATNADEAVCAVEAVLAGGIPVVEITMTVPNAAAVIGQVASRYGDQVLVGAGTVLTSEQAKMCLDAGAEFIVSPGLSLAVLTTVQSCGKLAIPGALTPTELMTAREQGAKLIKIFPCGSLGGPKYLKSLKAPFPNVSLIPTGGVNASNAAEYLASGAFALGVGAELVDAAAIREGKSAKIVAAARELVETVRRVRSAQNRSNA
jgi:2-dehydro-3-deoxyphosphogluconate aldolase/(4S)-4-hydroxy-2-oxoglutarate aldolase